MSKAEWVPLTDEIVEHLAIRYAARCEAHRQRIERCKERARALERAYSEGWRPFAATAKWPDLEVLKWSAIFSSLSYRWPDDLETVLGEFEKSYAQWRAERSAIPFNRKPNSRDLNRGHFH